MLGQFDPDWVLSLHRGHTEVVAVSSDDEDSEAPAPSPTPE